MMQCAPPSGSSATAAAGANHTASSDIAAQPNEPAVAANKCVCVCACVCWPGCFPPTAAGDVTGATGEKNPALSAAAVAAAAASHSFISGADIGVHDEGAALSAVPVCVQLRVEYSASRRCSSATLTRSSNPCKIMQPRLHAQYQPSQRGVHKYLQALQTPPPPSALPAAAPASPVVAVAAAVVVVSPSESLWARVHAWWWSSGGPACFDGASAARAFREGSPLNAVSAAGTSPSSSPSSSSGACVTYISSYGGGVCARDSIRIRCEVMPKATAVVTTQGFTKVYAPDTSSSTAATSPSSSLSPATATATATQSVSLRIHADALMLWVPEATLLHAGASFHAPTWIELCDEPAPSPAPAPAPSSSALASSSPSSSPSSACCRASFVFVELLHGGREARGELFDFVSYRTSLHVHHRPAASPGTATVLTPILHEAMDLNQQGFTDLLPPHTHEISAHNSAASALARRLSPYVTFCTVVLLGARVEGLARAIQDHVDSWHLRKAPVHAAGNRARGGPQTQHCSQPPPVLVSCTWIDVPLDPTPLPPLPTPMPYGSSAAASPSSTSFSSAPAPSTAPAASPARFCRGCVLRIAAVAQEPMQAVLALYLQSLEASIIVPAPWNT